MAKVLPQLLGPVGVQRMLAKRVRDARLAMGWRQSTLAERSGVSLPTVSRFERSGVTSLVNFLKMCHALGGMEGFEGIMKPARATSVKELEAREAVVERKRGRT